MPDPDFALKMAERSKVQIKEVQEERLKYLLAFPSSVRRRLALMRATDLARPWTAALVVLGIVWLLAKALWFWGIPLWCKIMLPLAAIYLVVTAFLIPVALHDAKKVERRFVPSAALMCFVLSIVFIGGGIGIALLVAVKALWKRAPAVASALAYLIP